MISYYNNIKSTTLLFTWTFFLSPSISGVQAVYINSGGSCLSNNTGCKVGAILGIVSGGLCLLAAMLKCMRRSTGASSATTTENNVSNQPSHTNNSDNTSAAANASRRSQGNTQSSPSNQQHHVAVNMVDSMQQSTEVDQTAPPPYRKYLAPPKYT